MELFEKLQQRLQALERTVATERCYLPNFFKVLDRFKDDDTLGTLLLDEGTPEERRMRMARYMEHRRELAFNKDKAEHRRARGVSPFSFASSSPSGGASRKREP